MRAKAAAESEQRIRSKDSHRSHLLNERVEVEDFLVPFSCMILRSYVLLTLLDAEL